MVQIKKDEAVCTSIDVAEKFGKQHSKVIRSIEDIVRGLAEIGDTKQAFIKSSYIEEQNGQEYPMYIMNRDGFSLLVMGFTGKNALEWKWKYIQVFNSMEKLLSERQSEHWQLERKQGKLSRKAETDALKELVAYAESHGSKNAKMLYITYSKLANATVGIKSRDLATAEQLSELSVVEQIILKSVKEGIRMQMDYHDIYKSTKERLMMFKQVSYLA